MIDYRDFTIRPIRVTQPFWVKRGEVTPYAAIRRRQRRLRFGYTVERPRDLVFLTIEAAKAGVDCLIETFGHHRGGCHRDDIRVLEQFPEAWYASDRRAEHRKLSCWSDADRVLWFAWVKPEYPGADEEVEYLPPIPDVTRVDGNEDGAC